MVLSGSNFSALQTNTTKVIIDGVELSNATIKDNALSITLPESLNGKEIHNITLTDGTLSTNISLI